MGDEIAARVVPAGWYADPQDSARMRWWDGAAWTGHVKDAEPVTVEPGYVPMQATFAAAAPSAAASVSTVSRGGSFTIAVAIIAIFPIGVVLALAAVPSLDFITSQIISGVINAAGSVALAVWDRRALSRQGYTPSSLPSPAYALLPILYLIMRAFAVGGLSIVFILVWAATQIVGYAGISTGLNSTPDSPAVTTAATSGGFSLEAPFSPQASAYLLTAPGMAAKVDHDLHLGGTMTCQPLTSVQPGTTTTCDAVLVASSGIRVTVLVQAASTSAPPFVIEGESPF